MTDGSSAQHEKPMCIRIWLEVGHTCEPCSSSMGRALAIDWRVWVRGVNGYDISSFVQKVVFLLRPSSAFVYPKRVLQEPPYEIQESGFATINIPIEIFIKNSSRPNKIKLKYTLQVDNNCKERVTESNCVYYDFENPADVLKKNLLRGGGEIIVNTGVINGLSNKLLLVTDGGLRQNTHVVKRRHNSENYTFVKPISWTKNHERHNQINFSRHANKSKATPESIDFKKILRGMEMTDSDIRTVTQLFWSYNSYETSADSIALPPSTDPIYQMPELPSSLKCSLSSIESD